MYRKEMSEEFSKSTLSKQNLKWGIEVNKYKLISKKKFVSGNVSGRLIILGLLSQ